MGSASQVKVDELDREDLDVYYFAFLTHGGYLMCLNDPLSLEDAKTVLYFSKTFKFIAKSCGVDVKYCGIYAFDETAAAALTSATGGELKPENHFYDKPNDKGAFYNHFHSGYKWGIFFEHGPHIWFGIPLIRK